MNCGLHKIRAKVGNFLELREICAKKSDDFQSSNAGQRAERGKHFAKTAVSAEMNFEDLRIFEEKYFEETEKT